ncbi:MAG: 4-hydroxy-tetrahydrodipicolinate reductase [Candidatus Marinimicrobia bacterium]|nr:4-hydroxy-tetrahydrodipicolinate reductase [Candidatus Neomarinimicrobiota bacterium]
MKYGVIGINGRMGQEIYELFKEKGHQLVFSYDKDGEYKEDKPEVLIDFSLPEVLETTLEYAREMQVPTIFGTTGYSDQQLAKIEDLSKQIPVVQAYNFSIGIQMLLKTTEFLKDNLPEDWDIEISETHHRFKKDRPSGTAITIADVFDREIHTTSKRLGNVAGDHSIEFGSLGEVLSVNHRALSRRTFAEGVLKSAKFIIQQKTGLYSFQDILFQE